VAPQRGNVGGVPDNSEELGDFARQAPTREVQPQLFDQSLKLNAWQRPPNHHRTGITFEAKELHGIVGDITPILCGQTRRAAVSIGMTEQYVGRLLACVNARKNARSKLGLRTVIDEHGLVMASRMARGDALMAQIGLGLTKTPLFLRGGCGY
jgi:hypothetical protein